MQLNDTVKATTRKISSSATFKLFIISILMLMLLIPASMVKSMIHERKSRKTDVIREINYKWGRQQTIIGPVISIPYRATYQDDKRKPITVTQYMHILPDTVAIDSDITPEVRYRGIYEAVLYNTRLVIAGRFPQPRIKEMHIAPENILWSGAFISMGITDMRGIKERIDASFNGEIVSMDPGIETADVISSGVSANIRLDAKKVTNTFRLELNINGSRQINFTPVGKMTNAAARSNWKDPSFVGAFLPAERRITDQGFSAKWKVLHLNRNYPQQWKGAGHDLTETTFGVKLFNPVDIYQKSMRTAKYALMFIVFTFLAFFISEVMNRLRVHPVQYLLIGLAIIVFYTLLLSISEHLSFGGAYLVSALAVIVLISGYAKSILKNKPVTLMVSGLLIILYGYLYILLQVEDYALLMGSIGLFMVLAIIMYMTRKIDWYAISPEGQTSPANHVAASVSRQTP